MSEQEYIAVQNLIRVRCALAALDGWQPSMQDAKFAIQAIEALRKLEELFASDVAGMEGH